MLASRATVYRILNATTYADLCSIYKEIVGYDPSVDDIGNDGGIGDVAELQDILLDFVREECYATGVHCSTVGL